MCCPCVCAAASVCKSFARNLDALGGMHHLLSVFGTSEMAVRAASAKRVERARR